MASFATRSELKILGRRERENFASLSTIYGVSSRKVFGVKIGRKKRSKNSHFDVSQPVIAARLTSKYPNFSE